jgi:hypothetical protein
MVWPRVAASLTLPFTKPVTSTQYADASWSPAGPLNAPVVSPTGTAWAVANAELRAAVPIAAATRVARRNVRQTSPVVYIA